MQMVSNHKNIIFLHNMFPLEVILSLSCRGGDCYKAGNGWVLSAQFRYSLMGTHRT